ncbi:MAG TPA: hypothetical protein VEK75_03785 [Xanthobacteraceae bacterium]|nr:hypothetical protein [Xanthobacteraceae bacterium]
MRQANRGSAIPAAAHFPSTAALRAAALGMALLLGACGHHSFGLGTDSGDDSGAHQYPPNYKSDIVAAMHVYLNDPTGVRDAAISQPALKEVGGATRYVVCVKFNPKKNNVEYAGVREVAAVFVAGRFDQFIEAAKQPCAGAAYTPFPELQNLPP